MPNATLTHAEILDALPAIVVDCVGCEPEDVRPEANFFDDLGGESIDQLDLSFRCERAFGIKSPFQPLAELAATPLDADGCLAPAVLQEACIRLPFLRVEIESLLGERIHPRDLRRAFTISLIANLVEFAAERSR